MKVFTFLLILAFTINSQAQLNYTFSSTSGSWAGISGTTIHSSGTDDAVSSAINIGFSFPYNCQTYSQVVVSSNGWLSFNSSLGSSYASNDLDGTGSLMVAPLWDDLAVGSAGSVQYATTGSSPNRIFTVEWTQMEWTYSATTWGISFQVKLYETSGRIEFIYTRNGNATANLVSPSASIGMNGSTSADFLSLDGVGASPSASSITETPTLDRKPNSGQIYRWDPVNCSGSPAGGTATATPTSLTCPAQAVSLSATGTAIGCGLTYQWQSSPDNSTWSNIAGATTLNYTAYPTSDTYYRLMISCGANNGFSASTQVTMTGSLPANDEPCNATVLPVNSGSCSYTTSTNNCASASEVFQPGIPAPGCGSYSGGDVWFRVTVPASGRLIVDISPAGGSTDMGMAWYTSTTNNCNNINTLVECDDDDSQNGAMPMICRTGTLCTVPGDCAQNATLPAGRVVWIRVWDYGGNDYGPFDICAYEPATPGAASNCSNPTNIASLPYSATNLTTCCKGNDYNASDGCGSTYQDGEDYMFTYTPSINQTIDITLSGTSSYTGVFVTDRCPSNGGVNCIAQQTNSSGNPTLCGVSLSAGTTYYIMVDTDPTPNCTNFNISIMESTSPTCGLNYASSTIAFSPDAYSGTLISLPVDDRFSPSYIPIGFPFCYDGIQYTQLLVSSNAYVIFDPIGCATNMPSGNAAPDGSSGWSISAAIPNTTNAPRNAIMFPWHDTYPSTGGELRYQVLGSSPNRRFVLSFNNVPLFSSSCTAYSFTGQLKLFETTNNIEMHIANKDLCTAWNSGYAILGLHNYNGTIAVSPAGYNYPNTYSFSNQAWRFTCNCPGCIVLPVELVEFNGEQIALGVNRLQWSTATETNNAYFEVQRMHNDGEFEVIQIVEGAGNSNTLQNYSYTDNDAPEGPCYYRLRQVDKDGRYSFSATIVVGNIPDFAEISSAYPNPADDELNVKISSDGTEFRIVLVNSTGQEFVLAENMSIMGFDKLSFNIASIPAGIYFLKVSSAKDESYFNDKIVIRH
ncbi:MAG: hypothetical protein CVU11_14900 [Bacteroidetes bacterium HGW-Bacteroidetes-6]|jgi:hypothetical protein|nr:MAG: hypothetical protein CVU11_14900 [Bacteroidetes bacterium HGW-Bacteroidetes-6]